MDQFATSLSAQSFPPIPDPRAYLCAGADEQLRPCVRPSHTASPCSCVWFRIVIMQITAVYASIRQFAPKILPSPFSHTPDSRMFGARALRNTARRVKERKFGKTWGPGSGVNDASKLLASLALFVGSTAAVRLLQLFMPDRVDEVLLWIIQTAASCAACRVVFFVVRRPTLRLLLRVQPWSRSDPPRSPLGVAVWEVALALLQPGNASTAFFEGVLPALPKCGADCALQRHLDSLKPAASTAARDAADAGTREALRMRAELDQDLIRYTQEHGSNWAWACTWKQPLEHPDAHVLARCFYLLDRQALPEGVQGKQMMRAAVLTMRILDFMKRVGNSAIPCRGLMSRAQPVPKIVPRCIQAFDTLFATSIEPEATGVTVGRFLCCCACPVVE